MNNLIFIIFRVVAILFLATGVVIGNLWIISMGLFLMMISNNQLINELQDKIK